MLHVLLNSSLFNLEVKPKRIGYHQTQLSKSLAAKNKTGNHTLKFVRGKSEPLRLNIHIRTIRLPTTKTPKPNKSRKNSSKIHKSNTKVPSNKPTVKNYSEKKKRKNIRAQIQYEEQEQSQFYKSRERKIKIT